MSNSTTKSGSNKLMDKRLIITVLVAFALLVTTPKGMPMIAAFVLLVATVFAVYHDGVQVTDAIVFFVLGVFLTSTFLGEGAQNIINTIVDWVSKSPVAG